MAPTEKQKRGGHVLLADAAPAAPGRGPDVGPLPVHGQRRRPRPVALVLEATKGSQGMGVRFGSVSYSFLLLL